MPIEFYFDLFCPWRRIGNKHLAEATPHRQEPKRSPCLGGEARHQRRPVVYLRRPLRAIRRLPGGQATSGDEPGRAGVRARAAAGMESIGVTPAFDCPDRRTTFQRR